MLNVLHLLVYFIQFLSGSINFRSLSSFWFLFFPFSWFLTRFLFWGRRSRGPRASRFFVTIFIIRIIATLISSHRLLTRYLLLLLVFAALYRLRISSFVRLITCRHKNWFSLWGISFWLIPHLLFRNRRIVIITFRVLLDISFLLGFRVFKGLLIWISFCLVSLGRDFLTLRVWPLWVSLTGSAFSKVLLHLSYPCISLAQILKRLRLLIFFITSWSFRRSPWLNSSLIRFLTLKFSLLWVGIFSQYWWLIIFWDSLFYII